MAHAPGSPGQVSEVAAQVREATGAACVALVVVDAGGNGGCSIAGPLEAQLSIPHTLEEVALQLRSQLASSVQYLEHHWPSTRPHSRVRRFVARSTRCCLLTATKVRNDPQATIAFQSFGSADQRKAVGRLPFAVSCSHVAMNNRRRSGRASPCFQRRGADAAQATVSVEQANPASSIFASSGCSSSVAWGHSMPSDETAKRDRDPRVEYVSRLVADRLGWRAEGERMIELPAWLSMAVQKLNTELGSGTSKQVIHRKSGRSAEKLVRNPCIPNTRLRRCRCLRIISERRRMARFCGNP